MATWTEDELNTIAEAREVDVAPLRADGASSRPTTIWVVRVDDELYVRSWRGPSASWFRAARSAGEGAVVAGRLERRVTFERVDDAHIDDAVDDAYRRKYRGSRYVADMVDADARRTTLKLVPS